MSSWLALLLSPALAIISLMLLYTWAMPPCNASTLLMQGILPLAALVINLMLVVRAWLNWRGMVDAAKRQEQTMPMATVTTTVAPRNYVAYLGVWSGLVFTLITLLLWLVAWIFTPCW